MLSLHYAHTRAVSARSIMPNRIANGHTLDDMAKEPGDKAYDEACAAQARRELIKWRDRQAFNDTRAAEVLGVNQATFHRAVKQGGGQPGLKLLIAFVRHTGMSLDEVLGLEPAVDREEERIARAVARALAAQKSAEAGLVTAVVPKRKGRV